MAMSLFSRFQNKGQLNTKRKLKNKGFSLIEVLVAIAILAVLSLPVLSAFMSAAKVNLNARREENANAVAQKVMEDMKAKHIEQMMNEVGSTNVSSTNSAVTDLNVYTLNMGKYDLTGKKYDSKTSTGDEFYLRVTLDPDEFSDVKPGYAAGNINNNINTYDMPAFTEVMSTDNFAIMRQVYQNDNAAIAALGGDASKIHRAIDVLVDVDNNGNAYGEKYTQTVTMDVAYVHEDGRRVGYGFTIGKQEVAIGVAESKYRDVYIFYTPFDKYRNDTTSYASKDEINIRVKSDNGLQMPTSTEKKKMNIYLVEQKTTNVNSGKSVYLDVNQGTKINLTEQYGASTTPLLLNASTTGIGAEGNINLLTNVTSLSRNDVAGSTNNTITSSVNPDSPIKYLYNMKVEVWVNETPADGNPAFWTVMSTKENANE